MDATPQAPVRPRRWPLAALLLVTATALAVAATALWQRHERRAVLRAAAIEAYDLNAAMNLAGAEVPPEMESFYFFVLEPDASGERDELARKLVQAAGEGEFVGIAGPDAEHNRTVLRGALARIDRRLAGLVIVYVGPSDHEAELTELVRPTGAQFRFVVYPAATPATI